MFWPFRAAFSLLVCGAAVWGVFFADLGGQSLASHVMDIWRAPEVQAKVDLLRGGVEEHLLAPIEEAKREAAAEERGGVESHAIAEQDRALLESLIKMRVESQPAVAENP